MMLSRKFILGSLFMTACFAASNDLRLFEAVKNGDQNLASALLKAGVDVNASWGDGSTSLHWAAQRNELHLADLLIQAGANVDATTELGVTPLWIACENGSSAMVEKLLAAGAKANVIASTGVTALMVATNAGDEETVSALLTHGADANMQEKSRGQTALMWAVAERHPAVVRLLVEHGADVTARTKIGSLLVNQGDLRYGQSVSAMVKTGGSTPLLFAARQGDVASLDLLVKAGANVNEAAPDGTSALVIAAHSANSEVAAYLLAKGADPNADGSGYTALHAAVLRGDEALAKILLARGANPNAVLRRGTTVRLSGPDFALPAPMVGATPYLLAAKFADTALMRVLAAGGADTHAALTDGSTAVMAAANPDRPGLCLDLNDRCAGASDYGTGIGVSVMESRALGAVRTALDLGGEVNASDQAGNTALHIAVSRGYNTVVELLVDRGAKLNVKNKRGETPLQLTMAVVRGNANGAPRLKSTGDLLRKLGAKE